MYLLPFTIAGLKISQDNYFFHYVKKLMFTVKWRWLFSERPSAFCHQHVDGIQEWQDL